MSATTIKSEQIQPVNAEFAITHNTDETHWPFAFEIDGTVVERFRTQDEAQDKWNAELREMKESGSAF